MIVCFVPNPAVDVTYSLELRRGAVNRPTATYRRAGGKGINVARSLRAWAVEPEVVLPLGGSSGGWLRERLDDEGFRSQVVAIQEETRSTITVLEARGHPTSIYERGPKVSVGEWAELEDSVLAVCQSAGALVVSGSLPPGVDADRLAEVVTRSRRPGFPVVVDTSGPALMAAARAGATCVKPNEAELMAATGCRTWFAGARRLLEEGARSVMVSRGGDGLIFCSRSSYVVSPGIACPASNPTGAGDAVVASVVLSLVDGRAPTELVKRANAAGAAAADMPVAGEIDLAAMRRYVDLASSREYPWD